MTKIHLKYYKNWKCDVSNLFSTLVICLVLFTCRGRGSNINWWQILRRWQLWWEFPGLTIPQVGGQAITWDGQLAPTIPFHCSPFTVHHSASQCITVHHSASQWNDILYGMHKIQRLLQQCECESFDARCQKHSCIPMLHQRASPARYNYALSASTFSPSRVILHLFPLASYYLLLPTSHLVTSHIRGTWTAQKQNYSMRYTAALLVICWRYLVQPSSEYAASLFAGCGCGFRLWVVHWQSKKADACQNGQKSSFHLLLLLHLLLKNEMLII